MALFPVCGALWFSQPEYRSISPVATLNLPGRVQRLSLRPRISRLYVLISVSMIDVFPVWYIDLTNPRINPCCLSRRAKIDWVVRVEPYFDSLFNVFNSAWSWTPIIIVIK